MVKEICSKILVPLCASNEVTLESRCKDISTSPGLNWAHLGMGDLSTRHGTPDVRVRGCEFVVRNVLNEEENDIETEMCESGDETSSDGGSTPIEVKLSYMVSHMPQTIATCVVSSFTERCLHPRKQVVVPSILIARNQFRVCLYDCKRDVLLISEPKLLATKEQLSRSAVAFLWLVINHR